jgi:adenylyltransferase/sulfurtransferase
VIVSLVASVQVSDALKILCGRAEQVQPRITMADVWNGGIRQVPMPDRDPDCPACAQGDFQFLQESRAATVRLCGRNAVQIRDRDRPIDLIELKARLEPLGEVRANEFALRFRMEPYEMTIFPDGRAIVKGTADPAIARSFYARYVG